MPPRPLRASAESASSAKAFAAWRLAAVLLVHCCWQRRDDCDRSVGVPARDEEKEKPTPLALSRSLTAEATEALRPPKEAFLKVLCEDDCMFALLFGTEGAARGGRGRAAAAAEGDWDAALPRQPISVGDAADEAKEQCEEAEALRAPLAERTPPLWLWLWPCCREWLRCAPVLVLR